MPNALGVLVVTGKIFCKGWEYGRS